MESHQISSLEDASLSRLLGMLISPLAVRRYLEQVPPAHDPVESAAVHYRNSLYLYESMNGYINRSAALVAVCFFAQAVAMHLVGLATLCAVLHLTMLAATVHVAFLGVYRQVLHERVDRYAHLAGVERPEWRDTPEPFAGVDEPAVGSPEEESSDAR